jgi:hypothetical protein
MVGFKAVLLLGAVLGYLFFSSPPPAYKIDTPIREGLVSLQKSEPLPNSGADGFCPPPGCGSDTSVSREDIVLELTDEQLTALVNTVKPKNILLSNIKVNFVSEKVVATAISYYPLIPGKITVTARLNLNHFYVEEVYIGALKVPKRVEGFIEANGSTLLDRAFQDSDIFLKNMYLEGDRLIFKASVPKGMIVLEDNVIKINTK